MIPEVPPIESTVPVMPVEAIGPAPVRAATRGFTLVELLVATAVLTVILVLFVQVLNSVSGAYSRGRADAETYSTGRALLDAIGRDLQAAFIREDLATFPATADGRRLAFYTGQPGITTDAEPLRELSFVEYAEDAAKAVLIRADAAVAWGEVEKIAFGGAPAPTPTPRTLSGGVLGFDYRFITDDGTPGRNPSNPSAVIAVRVSIAVADARAMNTIRASGSLATIQNGLASASQADDLKSAKAAWEGWINGATGLAGQVIGGIHFFERVVPLTRQSQNP